MLYIREEISESILAFLYARSLAYRTWHIDYPSTLNLLFLSSKFLSLNPEIMRLVNELEHLLDLVGFEPGAKVA